MNFLVCLSECELGDEEGLMHIVEADSIVKAIHTYKLQVCTKDPYFRDYVLSNGFDERFWVSTPEEICHFEKTGESLASPELFRHRITTYFADRPDLATAYLDFYFSDDEEKEFPSDVFNDLAEYLLVEKNAFLEIRAIPLADIPIICAN